MKPQPNAAQLSQFWLPIAVFTVVAAVLRAAYCAWIAPPIEPMTDAYGYWQMGRLMAEGHGYLRWADFVFQGKLVHTGAYAPLHPAILAGLRLLGVETMESQRLAIALLTAANVPLVGFIAREIANRATGLIAALLVALSPAIIANDGSFMREALYVPFVMGSLAAALVGLRAREGAKQDAEQGELSSNIAKWPWLLSGALIGLASLTRSEGQLVAALVVLPTALLAASALRGRVLAAVWVSIGVAVIVLPWTARNYVVLETFVPISYNYTGVLGGANCDATYHSGSTFYGAWFFGCLNAIDVPPGSSEPEISRRYGDTGFAYALGHVDLWPGVVTARVARTFGLYKPGRWYGMGSKEQRNRDFDRQTWWVGWGLLALFPIGLVLLWREGPVAAWIVLAPVLVVIATSAVGYGNPRFRAGAEPSLLIAAALVASRGLRLGARPTEQGPGSSGKSRNPA